MTESKRKTISYLIVNKKFYCKTVTYFICNASSVEELRIILNTTLGLSSWLMYKKKEDNQFTFIKGKKVVDPIILEKVLQDLKSFRKYVWI